MLIYAFWVVFDNATVAYFYLGDDLMAFVSPQRNVHLTEMEDSTECEEVEYSGQTNSFSYRELP